MALLGAGHSNYNLRYDELNHRLVSVKRASGLSRASSSQFLPGETRTFAEVLDQEVERIVMYYLRVQGDLASEAWKLRENQLSCLDYFDVTVEKIDILCEKYRVLAQHVIDLLTFLEYNVNSLRSIIRKYDAVYDKKIGSTYFDTRIKSNQQNSQLMQIYHQEGIRAIIGTIRRGLLDLHDARCVLTDDGEICDNNQNDVKTVRKIPKMTYRARMASFSSLFKLDHQGLSSASIESVTPRMSRGESMSGTNNCSNRPKRSISDLEPLLTRLDSAANRVMKSQKMSFNDYITGHSQMGLEMSIRDMYYIEEEDGKKNKRRHFRDEFRMKFGLYLNLIMTFVFTMNQYVIAPTSGQYARMLGMSPAMGGCIIGFSPLATLLGALIYSKWSNYSFRDPLLACVLCGIFGNLMYATALQCDSPALIFAGRLIGGLGGPRGIARRYIADHVATKDRTVASSQFIAASALGLASGPLMASLIERSHQSFQVFYPRSEHIMILYQNVTAPGWILCVAWLIQLVFLLLYFEDPLKSGASSQNLNTSGKMNSISSQINGVSKVSADPKYGAISTENVVYVESGNQLWNGSEEELPLIKNNSKQNYDVSKLTPLPAPVANAPNGSIGNQFNLLFKTNSSIGSNLNLGLSTKPMPRGGVELTPNDVTVSNEVDQHGYYHSNLGSDFQGMDKLRVSVKPKGIFDCCSHITAEVYVILFIYVINKTGQEIAASSIPILTLSLFSWDSESAGYYMGVLGAVVLPSTIAVGLMVKNMQDRDIAIRLSFVALIASIIAINNFLVPYSLVQFILGSAALFSSLNALEGIIMSLLSKLVSPELAKGTFNSGLLATEAGTFGRVVGDMTITLLGVSSEPTALLNSLYLPVTAGLLISIALLHYFYDDLTV